MHPVNFGVNRMNIKGARDASVFFPKKAASLPAAGVIHVTGMKFGSERHLWLRPFITAEDGGSTMYYNATVVD